MVNSIIRGVPIVTRKKTPTRIWNLIDEDVQNTNMKIFLTIAVVSASFSILYPPWGTQLLSVAVLNLCLHLMDLKMGANVKRPRIKKPLDIRPRAPETQTPQTQDVLKGLLNMGLKKTEAERLVLRVLKDHPSLRDTSDILKRCITLSYKK